MYYYVGSQLMVEWTNQHGCGPDSKQRNVHCELILQYTCGDQVRDGLTTGTPSIHQLLSTSPQAQVLGNK
jgi:hypothetical protein